MEFFFGVCLEKKAKEKKGCCCLKKCCFFCFRKGKFFLLVKKTGKAEKKPKINTVWGWKNGKRKFPGGGFSQNAPGGGAPFCKKC